MCYDFKDNIVVIVCYEKKKTSLTLSVCMYFSETQPRQIKMWFYIMAVVLPVMVMMQECPEQQSAPSSGVVTRPYQGVLINNIQWIHVPVLVNLTAWSPDMDGQCRGEGVTEMYKDLITTVFLRYHSAVAINSPADQSQREPPKGNIGEASTGRKLLGFVDNMLGASGTGLGAGTEAE